MRNGTWRRALERPPEWLALGLHGIATAAILIMLLIITGNAVSRQLVGRPISGAFEMGRILMPVVVLAGMAWTFGHVGHFRMSAARDRMGRRVGWFSDRVQLLVALLLFALLTYLLVVDAWESFQRAEYLAGAVRIPVYPTRILMALGCLGTTLIILHRLVAGHPPDSPSNEDPAGSGETSVDVDEDSAG